MGSIQGVRSGELQAGPATEGMTRLQNAVRENVSVVQVRTEPEVFSGWHHHGEHTTYGFVVKGKLRFEWGPEGADSTELNSGDFFMVPPNTVHREGNPGAEEQVLVGFRLGTGPSVINLEGPER